MNDSDPITKNISSTLICIYEVEFFMDGSVSVLSFLIYQKNSRHKQFFVSTSLPFFPMTRKTFFGHRRKKKNERQRNGPGEADRNLFSINRKRFSLNAEFTHFLSSICDAPLE
jgi:hypothetical protein